MPHIVVKIMAGHPKEKLQETAEQIAAAVCKVMDAPEKYVSVSVEEYSPAGWEGVFDEYIRDKDNVLVKPGYSNPKTFE